MTKTGMTGPYWLDPDNKTAFPPVSEALTEPNGLLAIGGDLSSERLLAAYRRGIFPWYSDGQPILWWSPNPRAVLYLNALHISRSLRKTLRREDYHVSFDTTFSEVIAACATPRKDGLGTWITSEMATAYMRLHREGHAHSIEVWRDGRLIGGLYGVSIGQIFFGESMFSRATNGSKIAIVWLIRQLQRWQFALMDCQVYSAHLGTLGTRLITREKFVQYLDIYCNKPDRPGPWQYELGREDILQAT